MKIPSLLAGALAFALFVSPVAAQECGSEFDTVASAMEAVDGITVEIVPPESVDELVAKIDPDLVGRVSRAFVIDGDARTLAGLEIDGCLSDPIVLVEKFLQPAAAAQECAITTLDAAVELMASQGTPFIVLDPEDVQAFVDEIAEPIIGGEIEGVTGVVVANLNGVDVFGLEIDGCLTAPIQLTTADPASLSGRLPNGDTNA